MGGGESFLTGETLRPRPCLLAAFAGGGTTLPAGLSSSAWSEPCLSLELANRPLSSAMRCSKNFSLSILASPDPDAFSLPLLDIILPRSSSSFLAGESLRLLLLSLSLSGLAPRGGALQLSVAGMAGLAG